MSQFRPQGNTSTTLWFHLKCSRLTEKLAALPDWRKPSLLPANRTEETPRWVLTSPVSQTNQEKDWFVKWVCARSDGGELSSLWGIVGIEVPIIQHEHARTHTVSHAT